LNYVFSFFFFENFDVVAYDLNYFVIVDELIEALICLQIVFFWLVRVCFGDRDGERKDPDKED